MPNFIQIRAVVFGRTSDKHPPKLTHVGCCPFYVDNIDNHSIILVDIVLQADSNTLILKPILLINNRSKSSHNLIYFSDNKYQNTWKTLH